MFDNLIFLLFLTAGTLGTMTAFALLFSKKEHYNSFNLGLFQLSLALLSFHGLYLDAGSPVSFSLFSAAAESFIFLAAPCSFLYVRNVLSSSCRPQKHDWLHLVPFVVFFCLSVFAAILYPEQLKADAPLYRYGSALRILWLSYAFFQTVKILNSSPVKKNNAVMEKMDSVFIRLFNLSVLILFSFLFLYHFLLDPDGLMDRVGCIAAACTLMFTAAAIFLNFGVFHHHNHLKVILQEHQLKNCKKTEKIKNAPPARELIALERRKECLLMIDYHMNFHKFFLKKDIYLKDMAEDTGIPANIISHIINSEFGCSFNDYINSRRVEYFIENINDPSWKELNVMGMALKCGFGSRTSCFRSFLKHTGKPPSYYFEDAKLKAGA